MARKPAKGPNKIKNKNKKREEYKKLQSGMNTNAVGSCVGVKEGNNRDGKDEVRGDVKASVAPEWLLEEALA
jgi:hypothetical protein